MLPRSLGTNSPVALIVIYALLIWPSIEGGKTCFLTRECKKRAVNVNPVNDCCQSSQNAGGNLYYRSTNASIPFFLQFFLQCLPCGPRTVNTTASTSKVDRPVNVQLKFSCSGCSRRQYKPVCGNDGRNYTSECELRKKACRHGRTDIEVAYEGTCQYGCDKVVCRNNGTCMVDQYKRAYCVHNCDSLCSKRAKKDGPLCGADGIQYESSCHLRKETCKQGKTIGMAYRGKCIVNATCDNINCGNKLCVEDSSGRPRCVTCSCNMTDPRKAERGCSENLQPMTLCGTDGKTYKDYSSLRKEMCKIKTFIDVDHLGACKGDKVVQGERPKDEPPDESSTSGESMTTDDISQYYISLKHFVNILKKKYGLDIAAPKYKKMDRRDKIVLMSALIKALKKNWRKVKPYP